MALCAAGLALGGCERNPATAGSAAPVHVANESTPRFAAGAPTSGSRLPDDILRGLSSDARVLDCPDGVVAGRSTFDASWVVAHRLDLDADGRDDWLVEGRHRCVSGPGGADWWVYAGGTGGARLLAAVGRADAVEVLPSEHGGFRDLRLQVSQGDVLLRYGAGAYARVAAAGD